MENTKFVQGLESYLKVNGDRYLSKYLCSSLKQYSEPLDKLHDHIWEIDWHIMEPKCIAEAFDQHEEEIMEMVNDYPVELYFHVRGSELHSQLQCSVPFDQVLSKEDIKSALLLQALKEEGEKLYEYLQEKGYC